MCIRDRSSTGARREEDDSSSTTSASFGQSQRDEHPSSCPQANTNRSSPASSSADSTSFFNRRPFCPTDSDIDEDEDDYRNHISPVTSSGNSTPVGSRAPESTDVDSVTCISDGEIKEQTYGSINDDAQFTPAESSSSGNTSPLAFDANEPATEDPGMDEDDAVSSSSDAGIPRISNVKSILDLPGGLSPIPGNSQQTGRGRTEISWNKEIQGTTSLGRHAFSARQPSPERQQYPNRAQTTCNSPASGSDIASWQVSQRVSRTQGPNGFVTNRELSVTGSSISVNDTGNAVTIHDGRQHASHSLASTCLLYTSDAADE